MNNIQTHLSRRAFVKGGLVTAFAAPYIARGRNALGRTTMAFIGAGTQGRYLLHQFLGQDVVVTAICDCDRSRRENRTKIVNEYYEQNPQFGVPKDVCRAVADFRDILADKSIDVVCIATPDHWHAYLAVEAMKAGKDVYCEKPLTHNVNEAKVIMAVAKKTGRLLQTGAMQRSGMEFRVACEIVRNGFIGDVKKVDAVFGGPSCPPRDYENPANAAKEGAPNPDVDFDMWCGPAPLVKYSDRLSPRGVHRHFPGFWRSHDYFGMGGVGDFGAHNLDIAQWGLGMDESGPVAIENMEHDRDPNDRIFDWAANYSFDVVYANGFRAHVTNKLPNGLKFHGKKGDIFVARGKLERPEFLKKWNEKKDLKGRDVHLYRPRGGVSHEMDFIDAVFSGGRTACPCSVGHRSITIAHVANICERLGLSSLKWDPVAERFPDNADANRLAVVPHYNGWTI